MIQELQTGILDINNRYGIDFTCKQLDDVILKIIVYDKSVPADLGNYTCRLKAFKTDQVPLIQNTNITIVNNVAEIKASKQLTTTLGIVKAELQFINKSTLEKKSTFYINIEVVASVLDVDGTVSTPTCTILEEIDHKLDQIENIGEVLDEAKEVRDTLTNTTIPGATSINSTLESNIKNASNKIVEVESSITNASKKTEEVEASTKNANSSKEELDLSKTNADTTKENLDTANVQAEKNIEELNKLGDVTELAKNVQTNTTDITNLKEDVENNTSQLKDVENDIKNLDDIKINKKVKYYTSEETTKGANPNNALEGCF
ncbi:viral A-type inclusion protein, partial [Clostridium botulinum]|nr:viral A-type inclusion protein [Clostridium botulinum]MCR1274082.1 viral A-type inclusion protein [Clostridium botulinum]NFJ40185.1 viral A-type inclusion protein [Clostridium botulinum B str. Eklund 17B (NRP)]NFL04378.1 viral A-type inclusion protein [Clostridium botulinum]NFS82353.1 viral A-type inclusion protein [Clostridium botulinum]